MALPASLQYLDPLLDELVEMAVADVRRGIAETREVGAPAKATPPRGLDDGIIHATAAD